MHNEPVATQPQRATAYPAVMAVAGIALLLAGTAWLLRLFDEPVQRTPPPPARVEALTPQTIARMDSPPFVYDAGWRVAPDGADPREPADPWTMPSGTVTFAYTGSELALNLAPGDYWGYIYVTVDDAPATELPLITGNVDSRGTPAGYKPLYAPETQAPETQAPDPQASDAQVPDTQAAQQTATPWIVVHRSDHAGPHQARIEVWRSWGQMPLRAIAVDALPAPGQPVWPGVLLMVGGALCLLAMLLGPKTPRVRAPSLPALARMRAGTAHARTQRLAAWAAMLGGALVVVGVGLTLWWAALAGVGLLALAGLLRPVLWLGAFLAALPFYFSITIPLLPHRSFSIIDLGVMGGAVLVVAHVLLAAPERTRRRPALVEWAAMLLAGWALVSATAAGRPDVALYEWRTVFLYGAVFLVTLTTALHRAADPDRDRRLLVAAWLAGATVMAAIGLWQFSAGVMTITAEGVQRVRGLYGSPNNLALYLERTVAVTLALALFLRGGRIRWILLAATLVQGAALLLTFSKGALLLAVPVMLLTLWVGGLGLLRRQGRATAPLWALAGLAGLMLLALLPFLGTERFQRVFDFSQGTGFLRLQLWRSSWQMARDHALLGVGPDNFLYHYRSGYILPAAWQEPNLNHPHNWFLDWWTRLGIPGLALGLLYWSAGMARLWRAFRHAHDEAALLLGLLAASAAALAHGLIDVSYALPDLMLVWAFFFALAVSAEVRGKSGESSLPG